MKPRPRLELRDLQEPDQRLQLLKQRSNLRTVILYTSGRSGLLIVVLITFPQSARLLWKNSKQDLGKAAMRSSTTFFLPAAQLSSYRQAPTRSSTLRLA